MGEDLRVSPLGWSGRVETQQPHRRKERSKDKLSQYVCHILPRQTDLCPIPTSRSITAASLQSELGGKTHSYWGRRYILFLASCARSYIALEHLLPLPKVTDVYRRHNAPNLLTLKSPRSGRSDICL